MKKKLLTVMFGAALVLGACGGDNNASDGSTAEIDAEKVYRASCANCHGGNLEGRGPTPGLANIGSKYSEDEIHDIIVNGISRSMPGGLIKGEELEAVTKWLAEKK
ncbi:cytochrome c551 [Sporosarcina sp. UB5]|uniref:cytochrome c551 n=1 Tax=Sporosarcina sp. UB5 TaxID=3047463 RepID=UPI003D7A41C9